MHGSQDVGDATPGSPGAWERLQARLAVKVGHARLGELDLLLPELADPVAYLREHMDPSGQRDLPYWTKLWPASIVLASFAQRSLKPPGRVLELGAGLGVPGLVCAQKGCPVVLSDLDPDALDFARAAVELNHLESVATVLPLDWTNPPANLGTFETVIGSEVLYHAPMYPALVTLLQSLIAPGGTAFLAHEERPFEIGFFGIAGRSFQIRTASSRAHVGGQPVKVYVHALTRRDAT